MLEWRLADHEVRLFRSWRCCASQPQRVDPELALLLEELLWARIWDRAGTWDQEKTGDREGIEDREGMKEELVRVQRKVVLQKLLERKIGVPIGSSQGRSH